MNTISSWSYSSLTVHEDCAYRSKLQRLDKIPDLQTHTAADRGTRLHQEAEDYVTGKGVFTHNLKHFQADFTSLRQHFEAGRVVNEEEWAFSADWIPTDWAAGWLRLKCDSVCHLSETHLIVVDYKSGQRFNNEIKHRGQLELYAVCAMLRYPLVEKVTCELWYLDKNELASFEMSRSQLQWYLSAYDKRGRKMTSDTVFKANPNVETCKYCPYRPDKQGDCSYGVNVEKIKAAAKATADKPLVFVKVGSSPTDHLFE